jgi:hypothetical protein
MSIYSSKIKVFAPRITQVLLVVIMLSVLLLPNPEPIQAYTIPTFTIINVVPNGTVTIQTYNFPPNQIFTVRMGYYGTLGVDGIIVAQTNSGAGGSFQETYTIPSQLYNQAAIAIRMDSDQGFYAYNWFYNTPGGTIPPGTPPPSSTGIPTFSIQSVVADTSVTILTNNFPPNQTFTVRMGYYGTLGVNGIVVAETNSGSGGSFQETYTIPTELKGQAQIAIRMESPQGFYAYNWFWNNTTGTSTSPTTEPSYSGIPTFSIQSVVQNSSVTVLTNNFPPNQTFTVRMGYYGTLGINGIVVDTFDSGSGGSFTKTFTIPSQLFGQAQIAIRMDSNMGFYAYNWFWNNSTGEVAATVTPGPTPTPGGPTSTPVPSQPPYYGIPTFSIQSVVQNSSVTVLTNNFPPNQTFTVRMGPFGTLGLGGTVVGTLNSGAGGSINATFTIPSNLVGQAQIAIRMDSDYGYYAYNCFWNNTTN